MKKHRKQNDNENGVEKIMAARHGASA